MIIIAINFQSNNNIINSIGYKQSCDDDSRSQHYKVQSLHYTYKGINFLRQKLNAFEKTT